MRVSEVYSSKFLDSKVLLNYVEKYQNIDCTISDCLLQDMGKDEKKDPRICLVLAPDEKQLAKYFKEKLLVLNKTNARTLDALYGDDADDWRGERISIFIRDVEQGGEKKTGFMVSDDAPSKPRRKRAAKRQQSSDSRSSKRSTKRRTRSRRRDDHDEEYDDE